MDKKALSERDICTKFIAPVVDQKICTAIEDGHLLIPLGLSEARNGWEPDMMLFQPPANDLPWQKQLRANIAEDLSSVMGANCQRASADE